MYKPTPKKYLATGLPILQEIPEDSRPSGVAKMSGTQCLSSRTLVNVFGDKTPQLGRLKIGQRDQNQWQSQTETNDESKGGEIVCGQIKWPEKTVKSRVCFIVRVLRHHLCPRKIGRSISDTCAVLCCPAVPVAHHFSERNLESQCDMAAKTCLGPHLGWVGRVSVERYTSKFWMKREIFICWLSEYLRLGS